jgi:hypothetical protein
MPFHIIFAISRLRFADYAISSTLFFAEAITAIFTPDYCFRPPAFAIAFIFGFSLSDDFFISSLETGSSLVYSFLNRGFSASLFYTAFYSL